MLAPGLCYGLVLVSSGLGVLRLHPISSKVTPLSTGQEVSLVADLGSRWPASASGDRVSTLVRLALTSRANLRIPLQEIRTWLEKGRFGVWGIPSDPVADSAYHCM